jgi:hypothetical protein
MVSLLTSNWRSQAILFGGLEIIGLSESAGDENPFVDRCNIRVGANEAKLRGGFVAEFLHTFHSLQHSSWPTPR